MKNSFFLILTVLSLLTAGCGNTENPQVQVITAEQMLEALNGEIQLIDVRTTEEFEGEHLKNAQNICVKSDDFTEKVKLLDKNRPVYIYCRSGGRSAKAAEILKEMGFKEIYDVQGGIQAWNEEGFETES